MKKALLLAVLLCSTGVLRAEVLERRIRVNAALLPAAREFFRISLPGAKESGLPGAPALPYLSVAMMLPPGESAVSIECIAEDDTLLQGNYRLWPQQAVRPVSEGSSGEFLYDSAIYSTPGRYPRSATGHLTTQYLYGAGFALCTVTPAFCDPAEGTAGWSREITIRITTRPTGEAQTALRNLSSRGKHRQILQNFAQNPEMLERYPGPTESPVVYDYLIIAPASFQNEFGPLTDFYAGRGIPVRLATTESIAATGSGSDLQEKIRNYILTEYQESFIQYVLLAGNNTLVPSRGFYCHVVSGGGYDDWNIPADLYYSGIDGTYDDNGNRVFAEVADNPDLLPELFVSRMPAADTAELRRLLRKTLMYQTNPVTNELNRNLLAGEYLWANPQTFGSGFMNLLIGNHSEYGYFTYGIPPAQTDNQTLYDTLTSTGTIWSWSKSAIISKFNSGYPFVHHLGHSNTSYMLRMSLSDITDENFSQADGITHNFPVLYTQGCYCGAFDLTGCIASRSLTIRNFLVAGVLNSRYGWFNEGTTDGPSQHLEREFLSVLFDPVIPDRHLGTAQCWSKIKTAPWISLPGEWEPGAQRWCHYCSTAFGDPALEIQTTIPSVFGLITWTGNEGTSWGQAANWSPAKVPTSLDNVMIPPTPNQPVISTLNEAFCHDLTIEKGATVTVETGKNLSVRGNLILKKE